MGLLQTLFVSLATSSPWLMSFITSGCVPNRENTIMVFYGRVVDQNKAPVVGADVLVNVDRRPAIQVPLYWWEGNALQDYQFHTRTDKDGNYTVRGLGVSMNLSASAAGYYGSPGDTYYYTDYFPPPAYVPQVGHPVVWTLWKLSGPQPLIEGGDHIQFPADGKPHGVDLLHGRKAPEGAPADFWITMPEPKADAWYKPYSWSYEIKAADGGVVETNEQYPFIAPGDGYVNDYKRDFKDVDPKKSSGSVRKVYYLKCHDGKIYARLDIDWMPGGNPPAVSVSYVANPAGSRNLEPGLERRPGQ